MPVTDSPKYEYQPFGKGYVRRRVGSTDEWESVGEVPEDVRAAFAAKIQRKLAARSGQRVSGAVSARRP